MNYFSLPNKFNWAQYLFDPSVSLSIQDLELFIKENARLSEPGYMSSQEYANKKEKLDTWYYSGGDKELAKLLTALWHETWEHSSFAMPAHDARHALFKVPSRAVEHYCSQNCKGVDVLGLIGALTHDWGRWVEERLYHGPQNSMVHSRFSLLLLQSFIKNNFEGIFPSEVLALLYESVAGHTKGASPNDNMPLKLVVRADRDQLYGPEFILRIIHHVRGPNQVNTFYGGRDSVVMTVNRPNLSRLQGPLYALDQSLRVFENFSESFLLQVALPEDVSKIRVFPEHTANLILFKEKREKAYAIQTAMEYTGDLNDALNELLNTKHIASGNSKFIEDTFAKFENIPSNRILHVKGALLLTKKLQIELDAIAKEFITQQAAHPDLVVRTISQLLLTKY